MPAPSTRNRIAIQPWILLVAALAPATGYCDDVEVTVSGHYSRGFEFSEIVPCDSREGYWFSGNDEFYRRYDAVVGEPIDPRGPPATVYARVTGIRSGPGNYGHMAAWKYKFRVVKVLEVRAPAASDCTQ